MTVTPYDDVELPPTEKREFALQLLQKLFEWAREVAPSQPLSAGVWNGVWGDDERLTDINRFQLENSDIITFHNYAPVPMLRVRVDWLRRYNRPILCTEYLARAVGSTFEDSLVLFKDENIGAFNWGLVSGRTQTIYPWWSWRFNFTGPPRVWFHDIFNPDFSPYREAETDLIRQLTGASAPQTP